jgi:hypothetical protein
VRLQPSASGSKAWKVELELEPEQIAQLHRQGLARGALVRKHGSEEWRPLLATPELLPALSKAGEPQPKPLGEIEFETPTRSLKVAARLTRPAPPPPPLELCLAPVVPRLRLDSIPDWNDVSTRLIGLPTSATVAPATIASPIGLSRLPASSTIAPTTIESQAEPRTVHARPLELSLAVAASVVLTLLASFGVLHLNQSSAQHALASAASVSPAKPAQLPSATSAPSLQAPSVPVVSVRDLPTEAKRTAPAAEESAKAADTETAPPFYEAALDKALDQAARDASVCGASPMTAPAEITFAQTGVVRFVRFTTTLPQAPVRACALKAVARARIPAFKGDVITVSKTLSW